MSNPPAVIRAIYRYPVKGLSAEPLSRAALGVGGTLPADRLYAIENGPSGFDPAHPAYFPKQRFLMLMRNERLARAATPTSTRQATPWSSVAAVARPRAATCARRKGAPRSRSSLRTIAPTSCAGRPGCCYGDGHSFSDVAQKVVSIINLASVEALENVVDAPSIRCASAAISMSSGWPAWHEFDLVGAEIAVGGARLKVVKRIAALRGDQCRSRHRHPRPGHPGQLAAGFRPQRLRRLCASGGGGRDRGRRCAERLAQLAHDPEKACPRLDRGWEPVFGKDHAQTEC